MSTTYNLCQILFRVGLTAGLQEKLDTFFAMNRLSMEEYAELTAQLDGVGKPTEEEPK